MTRFKGPRYTATYGQYHRQLCAAAKEGEKMIAEIIWEAETRGAKVTVIQDEIIIEESS